MRGERVKIQLIPLKANYFRSAFVNCIYVFDCHLSGVVSRNRRCVFMVYMYRDQIEICGLFCEFVAEEKTLLLFSVRDMSLGLRIPCLTKLSVVNCL